MKFSACSSKKIERVKVVWPGFFLKSKPENIAINSRFLYALKRSDYMYYSGFRPQAVSLKESDND